MKKIFHVSEKDSYLAFPIRTGKEKKRIQIEVNQQILTEFNVPIKQKDEKRDIDYYAYIPIHTYHGKDVSIHIDTEDDFLKEIKMTSTKHVNEIARPQIHFTPQTGWINDPNGLVYQDGIYHLYYQYNPFDIKWDNMSWGHAVSKDLMHWEEKDMVMLPDRDGMIFSGCAIVNEFALFDLPKDTLLYFYSAAGSSNTISQGKDFVQKMAISFDGGEHLVKTQRGQIPTIEKENRDPKVFWHEESNAYIMCMWLKEIEFAILRSKDLEHWEISQRFELTDGFECPDLFKLAIDENESKWVFWSADGFYYLGDFDGYQFTYDQIKREAYQTKIPYAAQTISNTEGRVISIPWLRIKERKKTFCGAMGLPREFSFMKRDDEIYLSHGLANEIEEKKDLIYSIECSNDTYNELTFEEKEEYAWIMECGLKNNAVIVKWNIFGHDIVYNRNSGDLKIISLEMRIKHEECNIGENISDFKLIYDKGILEITADNDIIYAVFDLEDYKNENQIKIWTKVFDYTHIYRIK